MTTAAQLHVACDRKAWATLVARAALRGYQLWRTDAADGSLRYFVSRWGMVHALADVAEIESFLERASA